MERFLLLRGLGREANHWGSFIDMLKAYFPNSEVAAIDLAGFGKQMHQTVPLDIAEMAREAHARQPFKGQKYFILSLSLGGMVATSWAMQFADELAGMVLMNSSFANFSAPYLRLRPQNWLRIGKMFMLPPARRELEILKMVSAHHANDSLVQKLWIDIQNSNQISGYAVLRQLFAAASFQAPRQAPHKKVLVLAAENDQLVHYSCSLKIAETWSVPCKINLQAGHDLSLDAPEWTLEQIKSWV